MLVCGAENVYTDPISGFKKCGISPFNEDAVLDRLPGKHPQDTVVVVPLVSEAVLQMLKTMHHRDEGQQRMRRSKFNVTTGMSVSFEHITSPAAIPSSSINGDSLILRTIESDSENLDSEEITYMDTDSYVVDDCEKLSSIDIDDDHLLMEIETLIDVKKGSPLPKQLSLSSLAAKEWIGQRRENIRPWALFINTAHLRAPSSLPRLSKRVVKNIEYFHSNYFFVFLGLIAYCLITSPFLLIAVAASLGACYILSLKNSERKISFMGHELTLVQQYGLIAVCSFPIFYLAGAGAALFWVLAYGLDQFF
uniref:Prenylated Rab acceptor protein 1 n=1 Tax=Timema californicum TaxID=61474 RepID=A0A7R9J0N7_TIMCA|nr:unnamed protein product [Timema californicum]